MNRLEKTLENIANFGGKKAAPFKKDEADDSSIKKLHAIGAKLIPIVRELDRLETEGDFHFSSFVAGAGLKLNAVADSINNYKG